MSLPADGHRLVRFYHRRAKLRSLPRHHPRLSIDRRYPKVVLGDRHGYGSPRHRINLNLSAGTNVAHHSRTFVQDRYTTSQWRVSSCSQNGLDLSPIDHAMYRDECCC